MILITEEKMEAVKVVIQSGKDKKVLYLTGADPLEVEAAIRGIAAQNGHIPAAPRRKYQKRAERSADAAVPEDDQQ